jgi:hypothetical protein
VQLNKTRTNEWIDLNEGAVKTTRCKNGKRNDKVILRTMCSSEESWIVSKWAPGYNTLCTTGRWTSLQLSIQM